MSATDGRTRGMDVINTGAPLSVPVVGATLAQLTPPKESMLLSEL